MRIPATLKTALIRSVIIAVVAACVTWYLDNRHTLGRIA